MRKRRVRMPLKGGHVDVTLDGEESPETMLALRSISQIVVNRMIKEEERPMKNRKRQGAIDIAELRERGYGVRVEHATVIGHPDPTRVEHYDGVERHITRAWIFGKEQDPEGINPLVCGVSLCRPGDQFDRRLGLTIAVGRARILLVKAGWRG